MVPGGFEDSFAGPFVKPKAPARSSADKREVDKIREELAKLKTENKTLCDEKYQKHVSSEKYKDVPVSVF